MEHSTEKLKHWMNTTEAAEYAGVTRQTISKWIKREGLRASKVGHRTVRISRKAVDEFLTGFESQ